MDGRACVDENRSRGVAAAEDCGVRVQSLSSASFLIRRRANLSCALERVLIEVAA